MATLSKRAIRRGVQKWRGKYEHAPEARPTKRGECSGGVRPCPYVSCRYNLFLDVKKNGSLQLTWGEDTELLAQVPHTCALDVAEDGGMSLGQVGALLGLTGERVRMIESIALKKLEAYFRDLLARGLWPPPGGRPLI